MSHWFFSLSWKLCCKALNERWTTDKLGWYIERRRSKPNESRAKKAPFNSHEHHEEKGNEYENAFMTMVEKW